MCPSRRWRRACTFAYYSRVVRDDSHYRTASPGVICWVFSVPVRVLGAGQHADDILYTSVIILQHVFVFFFIFFHFDCYHNYFRRRFSGVVGRIRSSLLLHRHTYNNRMSYLKIYMYFINTVVIFSYVQVYVISIGTFKPSGYFIVSVSLFSSVLDFYYDHCSRRFISLELYIHAIHHISTVFY